MNFAIIGYGKMGKEIERLAIERGHRIVSIIDVENRADLESADFMKAGVAFEFTRPDMAVENILSAFERGVSVVCGTTGWLDRLQEVKEACNRHGRGFFHASNFSLGMNILFWLNRELARRMNALAEYDVKVDETHHTQKLDAPSGTAIVLANDLIAELDRKTSWVLGDPSSPGQVSVVAHREGTVPGIHNIRYESSFDEVYIGHSAKNRSGFALGAVMAAEFLHNRKGSFGMNDLLQT